MLYHRATCSKQSSASWEKPHLSLSIPDSKAHLHLLHSCVCTVASFKQTTNDIIFRHVEYVSQENLFAVTVRDEDHSIAREGRVDGKNN